MRLSRCLMLSAVLWNCAHASNLVVNGSFEVESVPLNLFLQATVPTGWQSYGAIAPDILTVGYSGGTAADGTDFVDLIGGSGAGTLPAGLKQNVALTAGVTYEVSFAYNGDYSTRSLNYSLGTLLVGSVNVSSLNAFSNFGATTVWQLFSAQVTPVTTGNYALAFYTTTGTFGSPYVDDVSVVAVAVPEVPAPAAWLGLAAVGHALWRFRRR